MLLAAALVLELTRESLTGTHYRYRQYEHGLPTDTYITTKTPLNVGRASARPEGRRRSEGRTIERRIIEETPHKPWQHDYDPATGQLLRRTPLFYNAKPAQVFDPNPVVTLNAPNLRNANDAPVPEAAYKTVQLPDQALHGPWADLVDRQLPPVAPPEGDLFFDRTQDGFEDVNAYFHIHRNQEWVQSLGYRGPRAVAPYAIPVDAHAASGEDNSFFVPSGTQAGRGTLFFGTGGTDDAEDADIVIHEYAHALIEWIAPGTFAGGFGSEARALTEGTADYWAFSAHLDARRASGRDLYCIADWDARCWLDASSERCGYPPDSDCLRRVDSTRTMADYEAGDLSGTEHRNGAIWSSALRELREQLPREVMDTIVLEAVFGAPPRPTFAVMAQRLLDADQLLYQGAHIGMICSVMGARGILGECGIALRGELTHFQSNERNVAITDNNDQGITSTLTIDDPRAIEKIHVRVDIAHSARGDLHLELIAPDGTVVLLQPLSSSRTRDIHATYGLTAASAEPLDILRGRGAAGTWTLRVADRQPLDAGTLLSWGLDIQFFGEVPQPRPADARREMIPVVAHLFGQAGAYVSDVRLLNRTSRVQIATLTFTPSTKNGREEFRTIRFFVDIGQTLVLDDIVSRVFHTTGSGTLEILGDVTAMSRTYLVTPNGTYGQDVPPGLEATALGLPPLLVAPFPEEGARYNLGISETAGARGTVRVAGRDVVIEPFSHVQFPVGSDLQEIRVVEGTASIVAYLSQVRGNDAMFIPAVLSRGRSVFAPAITSQLSGTPFWRSDLWVAGPSMATGRVRLIGDGERPISIPFVATDVLALLFHRTVTTAAMVVEIPSGVFAGNRIVQGDTMQYVNFPVRFLTLGPQHLLFIENSDSYRTNIGVAVASENALLEITIFNAAGAEIEHYTVAAGPGIVQLPVRSRVSGGRAQVLFRSGGGGVYASLIDNRTGDATFFTGQ
ncbi:MAG TPA: proprotein convertase P-domain-containing protein [Thermoanaerobaculia bacterium]|nr:proprotein convertase P-domain-containing protein [Thermoanaerobaculia bacterium]